jgi:hypothetical protein
LIAVAIGVTACLRAQSRPSVDAIGGHFASRLSPLPVRETALEVSLGPRKNGLCGMTFHGEFETTESLFRRIEKPRRIRTLISTRKWTQSKLQAGCFPGPKAREGQRFLTHNWRQIPTINRRRSTA